MRNMSKVRTQQRISIIIAFQHFSTLNTLCLMYLALPKFHNHMYFISTLSKPKSYFHPPSSRFYECLITFIKLATTHLEQKINLLSIKHNDGSILFSLLRKCWLILYPPVWWTERCLIPFSQLKYILTNHKLSYLIIRIYIIHTCLVFMLSWFKYNLVKEFCETAKTATVEQTPLLNVTITKGSYF